MKCWGQVFKDLSSISALNIPVLYSVKRVVYAWEEFSRICAQFAVQYSAVQYSTIQYCTLQYKKKNLIM